MSQGITPFLLARLRPWTSAKGGRCYFFVAATGNSRSCPEDPASLTNGYVSESEVAFGAFGLASLGGRGAALGQAQRNWSCVSKSSRSWSSTRFLDHDRNRSFPPCASRRTAESFPASPRNPRRYRTNGNPPPTQSWKNPAGSAKSRNSS